MDAPIPKRRKLEEPSNVTITGLGDDRSWIVPAGTTVVDALLLMSEGNTDEAKKLVLEAVVEGDGGKVVVLPLPPLFRIETRWHYRVKTEVQERLPPLRKSSPAESPLNKEMQTLTVQDSKGGCRHLSSSSGKRSADSQGLEPFESRCKMPMQKEYSIAELERRMQGLVEDEVIMRAINIASKYPLLLGSDASSIQETLTKLYDDWVSVDLVNISHAMSMCRWHKDGMLTALDNFAVTTTVASRRTYERQVRTPLSYQDKGMAMMKAILKDDKFPQPMEGDKAETIWPKADWDRLVLEEQKIAAATGNKFRQEKLMQELLKHANFDQCEFEVVLAGNRPTKAVGVFKPDMILALKGLAITPYTVGALISLTSKGGGARYDNQEVVGALCRYGEVLLRRAGPVRKSILLGVTDLKMIRFFILTSRQDFSHMASPFVPSYHSTPSASVRLSLCGLVASERLALGIDDSFPVYHLLDFSWQANRFLGAGATSNVYEVEKDNQICALKVPVDGNVLDKDVTYLKEIQDVDGIPRLVESIGSMLVLEPVGKCVDRIVDMTEASVNLGDLVDVLYFAHQRNIVNRDVRKENIMIAKSLVKGSTADRPFLLDWGFAATHDGAPKSFEGSRVTASDEVLRQIGDGLVVYSFADDLVSLVRCTYLLCHPDDVDHVYTLGIDGCRWFWKQKMQVEIWNRAEAAAILCDYTTLGNLLTKIQLLYPL